jgi:transcriptional antiterminator NusG
MLPEDENLDENQPTEVPSADKADDGAAAPLSTSEGPSAPDPNDKKQWYIVKVQSGREDTIKGAIERRVKIEGLEENFGQIIVPVEKVTEISKGKRVVRSKKMFPGYIIAHVEFNDRILYLFRETSGVGDFVGAGPNRVPAPMPQHEIDKILLKMLPAEQAREQVKVKFDFEKGDKVRVRDGTFVGMEGEVKEIIEPKDSKETPRVRVELTIFGRPVPVEVEAWQVETV